jgi:Fe-S-cluster containining protein
MHRLRLAVLGDCPCHLCYAACCKQNGHEYAVLLEDEERRKFAAFAVDVRIHADGHPIIEKALPYRDGRCVFLGGDDLCTIYEDRPRNCRRFECLSSYQYAVGEAHPTCHNPAGRHGIFLQRNPRVLRMLETL